MVGKRLSQSINGIKVIFFLFGIALELCPLPALAEHYRLFTSSAGGRSQPTADYNEIIQDLKNGDTIEFTDGKIFTVDAKLGNGATTQVLSVKEKPGLALRIPLRSGYGEILDEIPDGFRSLYERGVSVVELKDFRRGEYVFVDKLPPNTLTFGEFARGENISPELKEKMKAALKRFFRETASFAYIGDMGGGQIKYDPASDRWILHDWRREHLESIYLDRRHYPAINKSTMLDSFSVKLTSLLSENSFDRRYVWLAQLFSEIDTEIAIEQEKLLRQTKVYSGEIDYSAFKKRDFKDPRYCFLSYSALQEVPHEIPAFLLKKSGKP